MRTDLKSRLAHRRRAAWPWASWDDLRAAWTAWRRERDVRAIERALGGLSDRQLALVGMSRASIVSDVSDLIDRTEAGRGVADEVLRLVDQTPQRVPLLQHAA
jgi:uncharacterized protein YjiS (DUF1127 family)